MGEPGSKEGETGEPGRTYQRLKQIALRLFPQIVSDAVIEREPGDTPRNLRIFLTDGSFLDVWIAGGKYSYHWQSDDRILRFDNAPHHEGIETHPHHMHVDKKITESPLSGEPSEDLPEVLGYVKEKI